MMPAIGERELAVLCDIAQAAGREIIEVYESESFDSTLKDDQSPLTAADLRADAVIRSSLERAFPGVFILSEESRSPSAGMPSAFLLVDPLDGTKEFLKRNGEFTVNIAFVDQGVPLAGVVFAPALGELFYGAKGAGAWKRVGEGGAVSMRTRACDPARPLRVLGSRSHGSDAMGLWLDALGREHEFLAAGSSLKFCRLAEGAADAYPRMGPTSQWDTAAGQAVLEAAGGVVSDPAGEPLRYGLDRPILNPNFLAKGDPRLVLPPIG